MPRWAAGAYRDVPTAAAVMGKRITDAYRPQPGVGRVYDALFAEYTALHDYFGRGGNNVLHRLRAVRNEAVAR
jgi:L-ribulokinase